MAKVVDVVMAYGNNVEVVVMVDAYLLKCQKLKVVVSVLVVN
jgi:hypothetical protein